MNSVDSLSPLGLTSAHIFCEVITIGDSIEALEAVSHGNRSCGFVTLVACPAAQTSNGPRGPGQAVGRMTVLLFRRAPFQFLFQRVQHSDLLWIEHAACWRSIVV